MIRAVVRESWYRFRATFRRRWAGYLTLVVLIGLVGGRGPGRRGRGAPHAVLLPHLPGEHPPLGPGDVHRVRPRHEDGYSAKVAAAVARVPYVKRAVDVIGFDGTLQVLGHHRRNGRPRRGAARPRGQHRPRGRVLLHRPGHRAAGPDGRPRPPGRDRHVLGGRRPVRAPPRVDPARGLLHRRPGGPAELQRLPADKPHLIVPFKLVGIVEWSPQVVQDDDAALGNQIAVITPALTRQLETCCAYYSYVSAPARRRIGARGGRRVRGRQGDPQPGPCRRRDHERPVRGQGGTRHPPRGDRPGGLRPDRCPRRARDQRPGDQPSGPAQRDGRRHRARAGRRPGHGDGRRARGRARRHRGRVAPGRRGRRRAVPPRPDRPGPARLPRHRRRLRLDRPRAGVPALRRRAHGGSPVRRVPGGAPPLGVARPSRPRHRLEPGGGVGRPAAERGPRHPGGPGLAGRA